MRDYVGEHFAKHPLSKNEFPVRPEIVCADGFYLSVQASKYHYSTPRDNDGPYTHFEVLAKNRNEPEGWVSKENINRRIHRHGGIS